MTRRSIAAATPKRRPPARRSAPHLPGDRGQITGRKADHVARDMLGRIAGGTIPVGAVLPKEADLAASYSVNRGVVREAMKLLEVHRLVRPVRRRGTEVLDPLHSMSPEVLVALLVPRPGQVDKKTLAAFLEVRALLDVEMTALATERRTAADLKELRGLLTELDRDLRDPAAYARAILRLPLMIARATKNPVFEMLAAFNARVVGELEASFVATRPASLEHTQGLRMLVDIIERRDVDEARRLVTAFHAWFTPRILASAALASGAPLPNVTVQPREKT